MTTKELKIQIVLGTLSIKNCDAAVQFINNINDGDTLQMFFNFFAEKVYRDHFINGNIHDVIKAFKNHKYCTPQISARIWITKITYTGMDYPPYYLYGLK